MVTLPPPSVDSFPVTWSLTAFFGLVEKPFPNLILPVARPRAMALMLSAGLLRGQNPL